MENLLSARAAARGGAIPRSARRTHQFVLQGSGRAIVSGQYPVSSLLPTKDELMRVYGVSASSIREALQTLTAKGLLMARSKVGTWVRDETHWDMSMPTSWLGSLSKGRIGSFSGSCSKSGLLWSRSLPALPHSGVRRTGHKPRSACRPDDGNHDRQSFTRVDVAFHKGVLEASDNPFLLSIGAVMRRRLQLPSC